jgi:hypothetical protein
MEIQATDVTEATEATETPGLIDLGDVTTLTLGSPGALNEAKRALYS